MGLLTLAGAPLLPPGSRPSFRVGSTRWVSSGSYIFPLSVKIGSNPTPFLLETYNIVTDPARRMHFLQWGSVPIGGLEVWYSEVEGGGVHARRRWREDGREDPRRGDGPGDRCGRPERRRGPGQTRPPDRGLYLGGEGEAHPNPSLRSLERCSLDCKQSPERGPCPKIQSQLRKGRLPSGVVLFFFSLDPLGDLTPPIHPGF